MTVPADLEPTADAPPPLRGGWGLTAGALVAWAALVLAAWEAGRSNRLFWKTLAAPLTANIDRYTSVRTLVAAVVGGVLVVWLPRWCARLGWRRMLVVVALAAVAWGLALALVRPGGVERGLTSKQEYPAVVDRVDEVGVAHLIDNFTDPTQLRRYPVHIEGHPLGAALLFVGLDRVGLGGPEPAAWLLLAVGATLVPAVLVTVREVVDEGAARAAAPFLVLAPLAIWLVSSADALFAAVGAWAIALVALACAPGRSPTARAVLGVASGLTWGIGINLSYGLPVLGLVAAAVVVRSRRWDVVGWVALGGAAVLAAWWMVGFWWFDGLDATRVRYREGVADKRPYGYWTLVGNPAAFSVALGPAAYVAVARVRDLRLWLLAGSALAAVAVANLSGLSKAEVERIWLPFAPWILVLGAGLAARARLRTALLAVQVSVALAVETFLRTSW